jgi:hypothetical protein
MRPVATLGCAANKKREKGVTSISKKANLFYWPQKNHQGVKKLMKLQF